MLKLNKLFHKGGTDSDVFEDRIVPNRDRKKYLMACKNKVRDHLKPAIHKATKEVLGMDHAVEPRFRTQGSWSYDTCVEPALTPPQEMDWDYGVYLPVTVWQENGPPHQMAKTYFELVERLLISLCDREGWELLPGKDTCIRIQVAKWAHIDIPLYAAPEAEFQKIREKIALEAHMQKGAFDAIARGTAEFAEAEERQQQWEELDHVVMATRSGEWKSSDPEAVAKWFRDRVTENGEQLRRVCRYLKAWRDIHWNNGGPTSVSIMIAAAQGFDAKPGRDDLTIEHVAKHLARAFLGNLYERGIDNGQEDFNRLDSNGRTLAATRFGQLASILELSRSLGTHQSDEAIRQLRRQFGDRIPNDNTLVEPDSSIHAIRATEPTRVVAPVVLSTKAG